MDGNMPFLVLKKLLTLCSLDCFKRFLYPNNTTLRIDGNENAEHTLGLVRVDIKRTYILGILSPFSAQADIGDVTEASLSQFVHEPRTCSDKLYFYCFPRTTMTYPLGTSHEQQASACHEECPVCVKSFYVCESTDQMSSVLSNTSHLRRNYWLFWDNENSWWCWRQRRRTVSGSPIVTTRKRYHQHVEECIQKMSTNKNGFVGDRYSIFKYEALESIECPICYDVFSHGNMKFLHFFDCNFLR
jgi:hypothetical protein